MPISDFDFFAPAAKEWFAAALGEPTAVQREAWPAIAAGKHTLVSAPTGTGKTLSAFLVYIDRMITASREGTLLPALQLIYISPLKSLASDIRENLRKPLNGIHAHMQASDPDVAPFTLKAAVRTGDTPQAERRRMAKNPPHILITTPESLYLLLTSKSGQDMLATAKAVIIDELHALIGTKRGAHLMLSLARIDALRAARAKEAASLDAAPLGTPPLGPSALDGAPLVRIGLSATIKPLELAAAYLSPEPVHIAAPAMAKSAEVRVFSPMTSEHASVQGTIWLDLAQAVYERCRQNGVRSVLAFTGGRQFAEKLAHYVNEIAGGEFAHTHHGSVSKERRMATEQALRDGQIRLLCATSSMELGIDVGEVDEVLQIGCPFSISSALQRLGRAGHSPGRTSVMRMYPRTSYESLFCGLTTMAVRQGAIESAKPPHLCLDILSQHLVSMAGAEYHIDDVMAILSRAYPFKDVTREDVTACLEMLAGDYEHDRDIPVRPRLLYDRVNGVVSGDAYSRLLAASAGGTIPDRGLFAVKTENNVKLGELDEEYVFEARVGDKFVLGAFAWRIASIQKDKVVVTPASKEGAIPPWFKNDPVGRPMQTGTLFGAMFRQLGEAAAEGHLLGALMDCGMDETSAIDAADLVSRQLESTGVLADDRTILVEHFSDNAGDRMTMVHSVFGRPVNAPLSLLLQDAAGRALVDDVYAYEDDNGILLVPNDGKAIPSGILGALHKETARALLTAKLPATALFAMNFRYNAARALLMGVRKAARVPLWVQRMRGAEMLASLANFPEHPIIRETTRECLEDYWDIDGVEMVLAGITSGQIAVREVFHDTASPMSLNLRRQAEADLTYSYSPTPARVIKNAAEAELVHMIEPAPVFLEPTRAKTPEDEAHLHSLLMMEGDIIAGEIDVPAQWFAALSRQNRACFIEPGLWIAKENEALYEEALAAVCVADKPDANADAAFVALARVVRRLLRYRGAQTAATVADRYFIGEETAQAVLDALCTESTAVLANEMYYHTEVYSRARHSTIAARRRAMETLPSAHYAAFMANRLRTAAPPQEQTEAALRGLIGRPLNPAVLETLLLPARVAGYRPAMLDAVLAKGEILWQMVSDGEGHVRICFEEYGSIDWDAEVPALASGSEEEGLVYEALQKRGATFAQGLYSLVPDAQPAEILLSLAAAGYVHADSFTPVRNWLERGKMHKAAAKQKARVRAGVVTAGRWEVNRPLRDASLEDQIQASFTRHGILCRETAREDGLPWAAALETLGLWEYTGKARRGYFIEGLSGAQFVRESDFEGITEGLANPREEVVWLNAADPLQAWGKALPHGDGCAFTNVPGTAVGLYAGRPVCVMERQGGVLRVFDAARLAEVLAGFVRAYAQRAVFGTAKRITVKDYPPEAGEALAEAGFARAMNDFTLHQGYM